MLNKINEATYILNNKIKNLSFVFSRLLLFLIIYIGTVGTTIYNSKNINTFLINNDININHDILNDNIRKSIEQIEIKAKEIKEEIKEESKAKEIKIIEKDKASLLDFFDYEKIMFIKNHNNKIIRDLTIMFDKLDFIKSNMIKNIKSATRDLNTIISDKIVDSLISYSDSHDEYHKIISKQLESSDIDNKYYKLFLINESDFNKLLKKLPTSVSKEQKSDLLQIHKTTHTELKIYRNDITKINEGLIKIEANSTNAKLNQYEKRVEEIKAKFNEITVGINNQQNNDDNIDYIKRQELLVKLNEDIKNIEQEVNDRKKAVPFIQKWFMPYRIIVNNEEYSKYLQIKERLEKSILQKDIYEYDKLYKQYKELLTKKKDNI